MTLTFFEKFLWRARGALFAAPLGTSAPVAGPLVYAGLFSSPSGVGRAARDFADGFEAEGIDVARFDLTPVFDPGRGPELTMDAARAALKAPQGTLLAHVNAPELDRALLAMRFFRRPGWRVIGYWVWETTAAPPSWRAPARRLTELWTCSAFSAEALVAAAPRDMAVRIVPHLVRPPATVASDRPGFGLKPDDFACLTLADARSSFHRKNVEGAVRAFRDAFADEPRARLMIKARNRADDPASFASVEAAARADPRIRLLEETLSEERQWALLASCDVFLSLHRAEGFGLPIAEAMALGRVAVATGWSGNLEFMTPDNSMLVGYRQTKVLDPAGRYAEDPASHWAEPKHDEAVAALRALFASPDRRRALGDAARADMRRFAGGETASEALHAAPSTLAAFSS